VAQDEAPDAGADQLADEAVDGRRRGPLPRECGDPLGPGVEADGQPVARDREAGPQLVRTVGDRRRQHDPGRTRRKGQSDPIRRVHATGELERDADAGCDRADRVEVGRRAGPGPVEVDQVDGPGAQLDEQLGDPFRAVGRDADAGSGAGPVHDPRATAFEVDGGDDLHAPVSPRPSAAGDGS
jgi:hypothetical protein